MKINLAKSAGFCFGVKRALDISLKTAKSKVRVYMLGDIVHNEDVIRDVERSGIKKIKRPCKGKNKTLLLRAHGTAKKIIEDSLRLGYTIVDATCPMVREIHKVARDMEEKGFKIIVIGDKEHDEVRGIVGQLIHKAIVIDSPKNIPFKSIKKIERAAVVVQSTQNMENVLRIINKLKPYIKELRFFNTICRPTRIKQEEIKKMPLENEAMIIIGSKNSANTKRLYEISKSLNPKTYWVNSKEEINPDWFKNVRSLGVTAGASTPDLTTESIIESIKQSLTQ
jgi:4-hydroxy-3-methylbut-2-enyl diphosphate reductase